MKKLFVACLSAILLAGCIVEAPKKESTKEEYVTNFKKELLNKDKEELVNMIVAFLEENKFLQEKIIEIGYDEETLEREIQEEIYNIEDDREYAPSRVRE